MYQHPTPSILDAWGLPYDRLFLDTYGREIHDRLNKRAVFC